MYVAYNARSNPTPTRGVTIDSRLAANSRSCAASSPTVIVYNGPAASTSSLPRGASSNAMNVLTTSSTYTSCNGAAGSLTTIGAPRAMRWQNVATTEL